LLPLAGEEHYRFERSAGTGAQTRAARPGTADAAAKLPGISNPDKPKAIR